MAGRSHQPNALKRREVPLSRSPTDDRRAHHRLSHSSSVGGSSRAHQTILVEDRISAQHREIQTLIYDNQRLAASHVALKQELAAADQELRHLSATAAKVKAERDAEVREVYEKSLKMDAEVHAMDAMMAELVQVRADIQKLSTVKQELSAELQAIRDGLTKASSDSQPLPPIKGEIDRMHHEIQRGRAAIEYEKRTHASNVEQSEAMEKGMVSMSQEVEKLHAELANAEKRARAASAVTSPFPGYAATYGHPDMRYSRSSYPSDPYGNHQVQGGAGVDTYARAPSTHGPPYHVQPAPPHTQ
ncbi:protein FLC EXPRESSOR isoform X2 [Cucurbita pepo subsp. pepo]|uniref:protein FLC EXPRESSOR isoform X2 n=1 Tax=Cucurbita pepo subsp. pepo TaxID=3664 RepID=UPI000C9D83E2|nr:protein FLC EXPRESSOR isoform X2 [Cucurbita pepo subsp. pepo]